MKELVTDTHAFLWHLYLPSRLGPAAREAFAETDAGDARIYIPALVAAEALMVVQKNRLPGVEVERRSPWATGTLLPVILSPARGGRR